MSQTLTGRIKKYLHKPYPRQDNRWIILVLIPLFISFFMVTFQPFGLQMFSHENKNLLLVGYGIVTFIVLVIDMYILPLVLPQLFREERWLMISEIFYLVWIVLSISAGNYAYSVIFSIGAWHGMAGLLIFIGFTFAIAIIPIVGIIVFSHNYMLRKNLAGADEISRILADKKDLPHVENKIQLVSANKNHTIQTTAFQLLCVESEGNYLNIWCLEEGKIVQHVIRNTVKNIIEQLGDASGLFCCHRAYIVNLRYIDHAEGNSQGYRLTLQYLQKDIPVSRNYTNAFNAAFRSWK